MSRTRAFLWLAIAAAFFLAGPRAPAEERDALAIGSLRIGFDGFYKVGHWTPLSVMLRSSREDAANGELVVQLDDGDGTSTTVRERGVTLIAGEESVVQTLVKPGRPQGAIEVSFESDDVAVARTFAQDEILTALLATQELFVEVGGTIGLVSLQQLYPESSLERPAAALIKDLRSLPRRSLGYDGVDLVVVTTGDAALNEAWSNNEQAVIALDEWLRLGGKLVLCVGREGDRVLADGSPLARFAPGRFDRVVDRDPGPWESFAGASTEPMDTPEGRTRSIATTVLRDVHGRVELDDGDIDLVIRTPYGFGEVLFVAADLERPPFADWSARSKLLPRLLGRSELLATQIATDEANVNSIRFGYSGLAGQLRAAVGQFAGARVVPFWLVFFLALCYAAIMFPLEYTIGRRWLRPRFEAAWVLLPLVLAAGAGGIWYLAFEWKGEDILLNKVEVTDVDLASGTVRGHTWLGLYSPRTDAYDLHIATTGGGLKSVQEPQLSWMGLPGTGLGGMNSQMVAAEQFERGYTFNEGGGLQDVPLAAWSSKAFEARWDGSVRESAAQLGERTDRQPLGILRNDTGVTLRDCVLFSAGRSYQLGTLEPGGSVDIGRNQSVLAINSYLTGRRRTGDKDQSTPYEPEGTELPQIMRAILFHDAAGGRQYTSLANRVYHRLDLTGQLRLGRAVLTAMGPPATRVTVEATRGGDTHVEQDLTFYRFVIPVDRSGVSNNAQPTVDLRLD